MKKKSTISRNGNRKKKYRGWKYRWMKSALFYATVAKSALFTEHRTEQRNTLYQINSKTKDPHQITNITDIINSKKALISHEITDVTDIPDFIETRAGSWSVVLWCVGVVWCGVVWSVVFCVHVVVWWCGWCWCWCWWWWWWCVWFSRLLSHGVFVDKVETLQLYTEYKFEACACAQDLSP